MKSFLVVIGDIISSRDVEQRHALQNRLEDTFQVLNGRPSRDEDQNGSALLSPFTLTLGDEFQAVYTGADTLFRDALYILEQVHPHRVRFSFGVGSIETDINRQQAIGMDGKAFHRARDGIDKLKTHREEYQFSLMGMADPALNQLFNHTLHLISNLLQSWHKNRLVVLRKRMDGVSVKHIAQELEISTTAVYRNIYAGNIRELMEIFTSMTERINRDLGDS